MSKKNNKAQRNFVLRIPNNHEGEMFYKQLRSYLNTNSYALDRKASGVRTRRDYRDSFNTTMDEADSIRVYLQAKTPGGNKQLGVHSDMPMPVIQATPRKKFLGLI